MPGAGPPTQPPLHAVVPVAPTICYARTMSVASLQLRPVARVALLVSLAFAGGCVAASSAPDPNDGRLPFDTAPDNSADARPEDATGDSAADARDDLPDAPGAPDTEDAPDTADDSDDATDGDPDSDAADDLAGDGTEDTSADTADETAEDAEEDAAEFEGPPVITDLFPQVIVNDGTVYIEGRNLALPPDDTTGVTVVIEATDGSVIPLELLLGRPERLVLKAPADVATRLLGDGAVRVTNPLGDALFSPVFSSADNVFSEKAPPGMGIRGNVYQLVPDTTELPDLDDACADPRVLTGVPCPFTVIVTDHLDVPARQFDTGFPGLGASLVEWFAIRFTGYLEIETPGLYEFQTSSDDGSLFHVAVDGTRTVVVDNNGTHAMADAQGSIELAAGRHLVIYDYFQGPRNHIGMQLFWKPPGAAAFEIVPPESLQLFGEPL